MTTSNPSIFIPRVHSSIDWKNMKSVFELAFGQDIISRIDIVKNRSKDSKPSPFNRAYVHVKSWPENLHMIRDKLLREEPFHIVYDQPHYWLCILYKQSTNQRLPTPPHIVLNPSPSPNTFEQHLPSSLSVQVPPFPDGLTIPIQSES